MNDNGKNGKQFVYREMGVKWLVTQLQHDVRGDQHHFKFRVDQILRDGGMPKPPIGHVLSVMSTEGYEYYAGWRVEECEQDPFEEREYPLRKGSIIRTPEGVLCSRSSPDAIPITSDAYAEINDVLDAYGEALDRIESLQGTVDKVVNKALERKTEIVRLRGALEQTQFHLYRGQYMSATEVVDQALEFEKEKSPAQGTEEQQ